MTAGSLALKLCRDCRWCDPVYVRVSLFRKKLQSYSKCVHPSAITKDVTDLVTGERTIEREYCSVNRLKESICGPDAKLFEPKQ